MEILQNHLNRVGFVSITTSSGFCAWFPQASRTIVQVFRSMIANGQRWV